MSRYIIAPAARDDLTNIWEHYAADLHNPEAADRIRDELFDAMRKLAETSGLGHFRSDLAGDTVRFWLVRHYLIIYRGEKEPIKIARVLHGARDVKAVLDE